MQWPTCPGHARAIRSGRNRSSRATPQRSRARSAGMTTASRTVASRGWRATSVPDRPASRRTRGHSRRSRAARPPRELVQGSAFPPDRPLELLVQGRQIRQIWTGVGPFTADRREGWGQTPARRACSWLHRGQRGRCGRWCRFADVTALRRAQRQHSPAPDGRRSAASTASGPGRRLRPVDSYQRWATSITNRDPWPGPDSVNTRSGRRARTPRPIVVCPSNVPSNATWRKVRKPATFTA